MAGLLEKAARWLAGSKPVAEAPPSEPPRLARLVPRRSRSLLLREPELSLEPPVATEPLVAREPVVPPS